MAEWIHASLPYRISDLHEELQIDVIEALLRTSYWAATRPLEVIRRSLENSLCFGLYQEGSQVGFMRVVTDGATYSWLCDVIVHPDHRGQGLGKWMMAILVDHPALQGLPISLGTRDAHGLYEKYGFVRRESMIRRP